MGLEIVTRENTQDAHVIQEVIRENEYQLPDSFSPEDVILDVGAHIGCFAIACLLRWASRIDCFEPDPANYALLCRNLAKLKGKVRVANCAVWRSDVAEQVRMDDRGKYTAMHRVSATGRQVKTLTLDSAIEAAHGRVRLLKLDCEGSEYPILYTSRLLDRVDEIVGEWHAIHSFCDGVPGEWSGEGVVRFLKAQGFDAWLRPHPRAPEQIGFFHARRKKADVE
jgi:FkbM family methyltransferase